MIPTLTQCDAGWKYYISYCIWLLFEVLFVFFLFPETSNRSLEELAFRKSIIVIDEGLYSCPTLRVPHPIVFEGEKIREEQQKRIEDVIHDEVVPISSIPIAGKDKEGHAYHLEHSNK